MKRRVGCFLLCLCFCFCSVSLKSSAVDENLQSLLTLQDLLEIGFVTSDDDYIIYKDNKDPFDFGISLFKQSYKNFPYFNLLTDIPWSSFPGYIQDIIYKPLDGLDSIQSQRSGFVLPFLCVQVTSGGSVANVFVGTNVGLAWIDNGYNSFSIFSFLEFPEISQHSKLYRLRVDLTNGSVVDWTEYKGEVYGNTGKVLRMLSWNMGNDTDASDIYLYGANGVGYVWDKDNLGDLYDITSVGAPTNNNAENPRYIISELSPTGFAAGNFLPGFEVGRYTNTYFEYFEPPSRASLSDQLQQEQNETSKSILERIYELPTNIANAIKGFFDFLGDRISVLFTLLYENIKGLFLPREGFFDTYQQEFQTYFKDRFGILYEIPELVISLMQKFITFNPKEDDYSITFPEVKLPVLEDGEWREEKLIEAQEFSFDFINEAPFSLLYDAYVAFIWLVYIMLLINLIKNKANGVFKGG